VLAHGSEAFALAFGCLSSSPIGMLGPGWFGDVSRLVAVAWTFSWWHEDGLFFVAGRSRKCVCCLAASGLLRFVAGALMRDQT
jgi:hypothetical protein